MAALLQYTTATAASNYRSQRASSCLPAAGAPVLSWLAFVVFTIVFFFVVAIQGGAHHAAISVRLSHDNP